MKKCPFCEVQLEDINYCGNCNRNLTKYQINLAQAYFRSLAEHMQSKLDKSPEGKELALEYIDSTQKTLGFFGNTVSDFLIINEELRGASLELLKDERWRVAIEAELITLQMIADKLSAWDREGIDALDTPPGCQNIGFYCLKVSMLTSEFVEKFMQFLNLGSPQFQISASNNMKKALTFQGLAMKANMEAFAELIRSD